jgi:Na+/H+-translocating membrane pyrophosphatase
VFAVTFALVASIWYAQFVFFRRYAMSDVVTVVLTLLLLFVVLFYVYPLKFVFTFLISMFTGHKGEVRAPNGTTTAMMESVDQVSSLMVIFSIGYLAVFGLFVLLYWHAYRRREHLELNELEVFDTRTDIRESALNVAIAAVSIGFGLARYASLSGMTYMLCPIIMTMHGVMSGKRRHRLEERLGFHENTMFEAT